MKLASLALLGLIFVARGAPDFQPGDRVIPDAPPFGIFEVLRVERDGKILLKTPQGTETTSLSFHGLLKLSGTVPAEGERLMPISYRAAAFYWPETAREETFSTVAELEDGRWLVRGHKSGGLGLFHRRDLVSIGKALDTDGGTLKTGTILKIAGQGSAEFPTDSLWKVLEVGTDRSVRIRTPEGYVTQVIVRQDGTLGEAQAGLRIASSSESPLLKLAFKFQTFLYEF